MSSEVIALMVKEMKEKIKRPAFVHVRGRRAVARARGPLRQKWFVRAGDDCMISSKKVPGGIRLEIGDCE